MIRLLARAFRAKESRADDVQPKPAGREVLLIAVRVGSQRQLVWRTHPGGGWQTDTGSLSDKGSEVFARPWERVELFNHHGGTSVDDEDVEGLMKSTPRLSFDAIADDPVDPGAHIYWTWGQRGGRIKAQRRTAKTLLYQRDRSCLFVEKADKRRFLIANVRLRNLLGHAGKGANASRDAMTWQFVVDLGREDALDPEAIWSESGDLRLRDILCCTRRDTKIRNRPHRVPGYSSFSRDVFDHESFTVETIAARDVSVLPGEDDGGKALKFRIGLGGDCASSRIFAQIVDGQSPVEFRQPDLQRGALTFVGRSPAGFASVRLVVRASRSKEELTTGEFDLRVGEDFLIQDQVPGERRSEDYSPRGTMRGRAVEWRLLFVRPRPEVRSVAKWWQDDIVGPFVQGLHVVKDGAPLSLVPAFEHRDEDAKLGWMAVSGVRDFGSNEGMHDVGGAPGRRPPLESTPPLVQPARLAPEAARKGASRAAVLAAATAERRESPQVRVALCHPAEMGEEAIDVKQPTWAFAHVRFAVEAPSTTFALRLYGKPTDPTVATSSPSPGAPSGGEPLRWMSMGALKVAIDQPRAKTTGDGWTIVCSRRKEPSGLAPVLNVVTRLPVTVVAGAVDRVGSDTRADVDRKLAEPEPFGGRELDRGFAVEAPLVIELAAPVADLMLLDGREAALDAGSHNLQLKLFARGDAKGDAIREIMVIDRAPFGVYLARFPSFSELASAESGEVAVWDEGGEGGAHWRLAQPTDGLEVFLPPQGIAEAMEKARNADVAPDPAPGDPRSGPVDFRFTPHARLLIDPTFQDQRYGETPWNVRRLFGYAEQRTPGSRLTGFDVELLYGLTGQARRLDGVMIAELEARLGRPAGRQPTELPWRPDGDQDERWQQYRREWSETRGQLTSRLGVLEAYALDDSKLVIERGLTWYQRGWQPGPRGEGAANGPDLQFPIGGYDALRSARPGLENAIFADKDGLGGGWTWGFTSLNILEAVLRDPRATSGFLVGLKFSALGGWGTQKVSFDEDRTSVYADTTMGRTHFYSLERIGRIAVCYNRAKHVIVFERTVVASEQFKGSGAQDPQVGRVLLRRVEEYIEFLECERAFPDTDAATALRGCVTSLRCKTKKIPVDSAWGCDVGDYGWKIPLWSPDAPPDTYPPPELQFGLAGDPEADVQTIFGECSTPELLYFYTDTRKGTGGDPDKWEPIPGVDCGTMSARWIDDGAPGLQTSAGERLDGPLPPEVPVPPGLHEFTYGIKQLERPVNLVADRAEAALNAVLHNVTLMRATEYVGGDDPPRELARECTQLYQQARRLEHELKGLAESGRSLAELKSAANEALEAGLGAAASFRKLARGAREKFRGIRASDPCEAARRAAEGAFGRWNGLFLKGLGGAREAVLSAIVAAETALARAIRTDLAQAREELARRRGHLKAFVVGVREDLGRTFAEAASRVVNVQAGALAGAHHLKAELQRFVQGAGTPIDAIFDRMEKELRELRQSFGKPSLEAAFGRAEELRDSARSALQRAQEVLAKIDRTAVSKGDKLGKVINKTKLRKRLAEARARIQRFAAESERVLGWAIGQRPRAVEAREQIKLALDDLQGKVQTIRELVNAACRAIHTDIEDVLDGYVKGICGSGQVLRGALADAEGPLRTLFSLPETLLDELDAELGDGADVESVAASVEAGVYASARVHEAFEAAERAWQEQSKALGESTVDAVAKACGEVSDEVVSWLHDFGEEPAKKLLDAAKEALDVEDLEELKRQLETTAEEIVGEATAAFEEARAAIEASPVGPILQNPDRALRLIRAFGDPPKLPRLDFNRAAVAFVFGDPRDAIDITPVTAWYNQVGDDLKALGIRLPTAQMLDRLIPADLKDINLGKLLPDFAGLKLDRLFPRLTAPAALRDAVRLTHGLDKQRQRAWVAAKVDLRLDDRSELFSLGPLTVTLYRAHFDAVARIEVGLDGKVERQCRGALVADWELAFGGQVVITFTETALRFDESGRMRFDLSPDRIELAPALRYLSDLAKLVEYDDGGFVLRLLERNGIPYGAEATFAVTLPPLQYGSTGVIGAAFGAGLRLEAYPDFALTLQANVSRSHSPFIFSVFILGGAGHVEIGASYLPFRNALSADVSINVAASASLAFAFGPICGQVAVLLGVSVEYHRRPGQTGGGLDMGLFLQITGRVDVKFLVSVNLSLRLTAHYTEGRIRASGSLTIRVRISRFFKFTVSTTVEYDFRSGRTQTVHERSASHPAIKGAKRLAGASV